MLDFLTISAQSKNKGVVEIKPDFRTYPKSNDLMIRGGDFYAVWVEERGLWSTDEQDALRLIDRELDIYAEENKNKFDSYVKVLHMRDAGTRMIESWHRFCKKDLRDNFHMLDEKLIFANSPVNKKDYSSKRLSYSLEPGDYSAYDTLISTLYSPEERRKIEWAIGSIVNGDSKKIQKFLVLYGASGTGKSTILKIIEQLFKGYYSTFDAKSIGSASSAFALESFKTESNSAPLVSIQHDGDLSRIEDNTRLNSLVSHELMNVNEKNRSIYSNRFKTFLFMGTNRPVKITDAKSGLLRRLIDVSPTGDLIARKEYDKLIAKIDFELGAIAWHCKEVYEEDPGYFDNYVPIGMLDASNDFYNFIQDKYYDFRKEKNVSLKFAWTLYNQYCEDANVPSTFKMRQMIFKEELKNYFYEYYDRYQTADGDRIRSYYVGFKSDIFTKKKVKTGLEAYTIVLDAKKSLLDDILSDCPAQYATEDGVPGYKWSNVKTKLSDIDTSKLHYVKVPEEHIVIDFDIPDDEGNKCLEKNLEEASKWPATYTELSKSGKGVHLHYIYNGDVTKLAKKYDDHIEVKVFTGNSALRRMVTKCNAIPVSTISSGLPMKGEKKVIKQEQIRTEKALRNFIKKCLNKDHHGATKPEVDFIKAKLDEMYESGVTYDISDMEPAIISFAAASSNKAQQCLELCNQMKFKSEDHSDWVEPERKEIVFYDVEVFPNLFLINWKLQGKGKTVVRMINPTKEQVEQLIKNRLIGFNCRRYDNHMLYARLMGYSNEQLYLLSQKIINGDSGSFFGEAYNLSYTDVYDFSSKKQSLKKWEIELGIHHQELGLPWDQPVPEELWTKVAEYCDADVIATEAVFDHCKGDFLAREILADLAGMSVNDTTNTLTTRIIFGKERNPQDKFNYRNLSEPVLEDDLGIPYPTSMLTFTAWNGEKSAKPFFPGYSFESGKSYYRGFEVGEGGFVYAEPFMYGNIALIDVASMHPSSVVAEELFGEYTQNFADILYARIAIKHKDFDTARKMFGGKLAKYLTDEESAANLAQALKIAINSVYGLTAAKFINPFKDIRNIDNIVAKRGALFMIDLMFAVQEKGFTVAHIKTDSIKIPDATPEIVQFVLDFGKKYGYTFEHEATYDRMCLVNDAVYIAKYKDGKYAGEWTATGTQFKIPYVFKTLFSKEKIAFEDLCETKEVKKGVLYLDMNEGLNEGEHSYQFVGRVGSFCPIKEGCGGGVLYRCDNDKYYAATGTKGYRWLEAEYVQNQGKEDDIDISYYDKMVDEASKTITAYGDLNWFVSDEPYKDKTLKEI